jgi:hypothetical protein
MHECGKRGANSRRPAAGESSPNRPCVSRCSRSAVVRRALLAGAALAAAWAGSARAAADPTPAQSRLGLNIAGPADYSSEHAFVDVFRQARSWVSQRPGQPWGKGPALDCDTNGWVRRLEPGCSVETPILTEANGHAPAGDYVCLYEGDGTIDFNYNARIVSREPGRIVVTLDTAKGGTFLRLLATNPTNYVRNIRVIMPGFERTYAADPFYPPFLARCRPFNTIRFMDWMHTNGSRQRDWAERPTPAFYTHTARGTPVETMCDLCNRLRANAWFCLPHLATDDYVAQFAALVRRRLSPELKVYIEYSNEVWNGMFEQHRYAEERGRELRLGPPERPWEGAARYYGQRSQEIFKLWEQAFGGRERLVRVVAWQAAAGTYWTDGLVLGPNDTGRHADVLAIAPYITMCIGPQTKPDAKTVAGWSVDQVLDHAATNALPQSLGWISTQKAVADKYGLKLVAYEAGQHLVGVGGAQNDDALTAVFMAANRHPRMGGLYARYLDAWQAAGGDLLCIFSSTGRWSKWGSWGLTEYLDEGESGHPKYKAVMEWNRAHARK